MTQSVLKVIALFRNDISAVVVQCTLYLNKKNSPLRVSLLTGTFCDGHWDDILCWPPTEMNTTVTLPCPVMKGSDPSSK